MTPAGRGGFLGRRSPVRVQRASHFADINANNIANAGGPDVWYTDAYGRNGRPEPFTARFVSGLHQWATTSAWM